ncbi:Alpha/Beta hydrolase protein [Trichoderma austrokoningii]
MFFSNVLNLAMAGLAAAKPLTDYTPASPTCFPITFHVDASAENVIIANAPSEKNAAAVYDFMLSTVSAGSQTTSGTRAVSGDFVIEGTYCIPPPTVRDVGALQFLVHGVTYNKTVWAGLGISQKYNWHSYATNAGYHTLAIDCLGHGQDPQHPDPLNVVQGTLHVEIMHQIISRIRGGLITDLFHARKTIIYVGHSYGSGLGNLLSIKHPEDIDAYVLTGFSATLTPPSSFFNDLFSAADVSDRFKNYPLGYLTGRTVSGRRAVFYAGAYDNSIVPRDFAGRDIVSVEEFFSPGLFTVASNYTGPVFVATGDLDKFYCAGGPVQCKKVLESTKAQNFPFSTNYGTYMAPNTGHCLSLHYSVPATAAAINAWLTDILENLL